MELQPRRQRQTAKLIKRNENHDSHRAAWRVRIIDRKSASCRLGDARWKGDKAHIRARNLAIGWLVGPKAHRPSIDAVQRLFTLIIN